jgi:hypothetical protein
MDDQFEQGTSRQAWKAATGQATHNHGRQGYAGPHSPGEVGRLGTAHCGRTRCASMGMATQAR